MSGERTYLSDLLFAWPKVGRKKKRLPATATSFFALDTKFVN
jgi:hypothetical protein